MPHKLHRHKTDTGSVVAMLQERITLLTSRLSLDINSQRKQIIQQHITALQARIARLQGGV